MVKELEIEEKKNERLEMRELRLARERIVKKAMDTQMRVLEQNQYNRDVEIFNTSHDKLNGAYMHVKLDQKRKIAVKYGWDCDLSPLEENPKFSQVIHTRYAHNQATSIRMQISIETSSVLMNIIIVLLMIDRLDGGPRNQIIKITCNNQRDNDATQFSSNFIQTSEKLGNEVRSSLFATASAGTGPDANYGLVQCYGDLSTTDCILCYDSAHYATSHCFPYTGAVVYQEGCFMRFQNYSFYEEYEGPNDTFICGNSTRKNSVFQDSARQAVSTAVRDALTNDDYFARKEVIISGTMNDSAYVLANCWRTLTAHSCRICLEAASVSILQCLPWSEGRALMTGCFMRYSDTDFLIPVPSRSKNRVFSVRMIAVITAVVSSIVILAVTLLICLYIRRRRWIQKKRKGLYDAKKLAKILTDSSLNFKYSTIEKATSSWDDANKLGEGGFGTVYKGVLPDGREIAVKRLFFNNKFRAADFYNEVNMISSLEHKNLVRLLGCSCSGPESFLVYEYLPNMSLDRFIFDAIKGKELNWEKRVKIIIGTTEGLVYLHENTKTRIIHRDIKAANILLDLRLRAKIADFGLARSFQGDMSHISTAIAGTLGYMAPEYLALGQLTEKADVYSYGVLLLEVVTGIQNNRSKNSEHSHSLVSLAWRRFQQGRVEEILDPNLMFHTYHNLNFKKEAIKVVHVGLLCTQEAPSLRPSISMALKMLVKHDESLPTPSNPPFIRDDEINEVEENIQSYHDDDLSSVATVSHDQLSPRCKCHYPSDINSHVLPKSNFILALCSLTIQKLLQNPDHAPAVPPPERNPKLSLHSQATSVRMQISIELSSVLRNIIIVLLMIDRLEGAPRTQVIKLFCNNRTEHNTTAFSSNFIQSADKVSNIVQSSHFATASTGSGLDASYVLAQCYGDLSATDCYLCYDAAHYATSRCFPYSGAAVYHEGCFMRFLNYSFYEEYKGPTDTSICGNTTRKNGVFQDSARQAVSTAVRDALTNDDYFARKEVIVSGTVNESAYVLANCWKTLNANSCRICLEAATVSILQCLPWSEGHALMTGCYMRYSDTDFLNPVPIRSKNRGKMIAVTTAVVSSIVILAVALLIALYIRRRRWIQKKRTGSYDPKKLAKILTDSSLNFKYSTIDKATSSWNDYNKIGEGGFGIVYKGVLPDGREIAVKRLFLNNKFRAIDFYNEVNMISSLEHKNLVRLLGCSCSGPESFLVYEYLPNMSLDRFIFDATKGKQLNWEKRFEIIIDTTEGLVYLHENTKTRIIHRDIKAANILLDLRFRAKIADFGLARSFQGDMSHISTAIAGTLGYMAPEYLAHGQLTEKADVYSYGVLLLEVVTGMQNNRSKDSEYSDSLVSIAWRHFQQGRVEEILDPNLMFQTYPNPSFMKEAIKVVHVGLLCVQEDSNLRPSISMALKMLVKHDESLPEPSNPPFVQDDSKNQLEEENIQSYQDDDSSSVATVSHYQFSSR
ncbi:hypothetical protein SSX86_020944 [Deinandra increscens subsp. villosa]|uniref:Cysteine-rich receptor-like protein kinase 2 n=1 Tax=Deinandra increscens subsp. villosa TaxID=3103831 RepID=A0AAP0GV94_9ASTR